MATPQAAFLFAFLLSASVMDEVNVSFGAVQKLVDYQYNFLASELVPGQPYNSSVTAKWAIPDSALAGLEGKKITVKVSALAENESDLFFILPSGASSKQAEAYLFCEVQNGSCSNSSKLSADFPLTVTIKQPGETESTKITFKSEMADGVPLLSGESVQKSAGDLLETFKSAFSQNGSQIGAALPNESIFPNVSPNLSAGANFLDSLKPEGNPRDPVEFLRQNPLISIAALAIVVIITGAYLLNVKD